MKGVLHYVRDGMVLSKVAYVDASLISCNLLVIHSDINCEIFCLLWFHSQTNLPIAMLGSLYVRLKLLEVWNTNYYCEIQMSFG